MERIMRVESMSTKTKRSKHKEETRWIRSFGQKYRVGIFLCLILGGVSAVLGLGGSIAFRYIVEDLITGSVERVRMLALLICGVILMKLAITGLYGSLSAKLTISIRNDIWFQTFKQMLETDWEALREYRIGDLTDRLDRDVNAAASSISSWGPDFFTAAVRFVGTAAVLFYYDISLAVLAVTSVPLSVLISRNLMKGMHRHHKRLREAGAQVTAFHQEALQHVGLIQAFDMQEYFGWRLTEVQKKYRRVFLEYRHFSLSTTFFLSVVCLTATLACYGWSLYRMWNGGIGFGTFVLFLYLVRVLSESFGTLSEMASSTAEAAIAAGRLMEVCGLPQEARLDEEWTEFLAMRGKEGISLLFENVDFRYRSGEPVLECVSWEAHPGEWVGIAGGSGEGKTTLIRLMLGLVLPSDGVVELRHPQGLNCLVSAATRPFISYVPQENSLFPGTVADNLRLGLPDAEESELWRALEVACASEFVAELPHGLYTILGSQGITVSEGQAQRLAIARAVLRDAPICLLDEATSALDSDTERAVLSNLKQAFRGKTCIITSHRLHVLGRCDRVYRLEETLLEPTGTLLEEHAGVWEDLPYNMADLLETFA